ncbi:uncharacterized protein LOC18426006 isoform X2 [Amborella trichopoda]|uniref:uncharacterized protein LOC18426006 isoform X2 n=1 Tax=Amborella trichopoda TaxID=13333 RepID=UPI0005D3C93E|nr:uncharacterized protein LOC18426006 isoform X2 [Amborella trichopoda]|eukprot:XP_011620355.1 uncharacterized protein LOC18426006 isoform X2 [Amborella trichopoda]
MVSTSFVSLSTPSLSPRPPHFPPPKIPTLLFLTVTAPGPLSRASKKPLKSTGAFHVKLSAIAEANQPGSLKEDSLPLLQQVADCLVLPPDYFSQLPGDLRIDLNDAAFDLSNGPVLDECGQELGEMLLNLSRAWELADAQTSCSIATLGKRFLAAGRRFETMGQYGQGELQKIAKAMAKAGKALTAGPVLTTNETPTKESRMFKFGELQVALTPEKANIGAAIGFVFGIISWELSQGISSIPESSLQYANDNALLLAKSLRGALLALGYSCTALSAFSAIGLLLLARQLSSGNKS